MRIMGSLCLLIWFIPALSAQARDAAACPIVIGVSTNGDFYMSRFNGWYKTNPKLVEDVVSSGCYPDFPEHSSKPITNVSLELSPGAPAERVNLIFEILARKGWTKERLVQLIWTNSPRKPLK